MGGKTLQIRIIPIILEKQKYNLEVAGSSPAPATKTKRYGFDDI